MRWTLLVLTVTFMGPWLMGCGPGAVEESDAKGPAVDYSYPLDSRKLDPNFDGTRIRIVPEGALIYGAARNLDFISDGPSGDVTVGQIEAMRQRIAGAQGKEVAQWVQRITEDLKAKGLVRSTFLEVFSRGFSFAFYPNRPDSKEPEVFIVAEATPAIDKALDVIRSGAAQKKDLQLSEEELGGVKVTCLAREGAEKKLYVAPKGSQWIGATDRGLLLKSLALDGKRSKGSLVGAEWYLRGKGRCLAEATAFLAVDLPRFLDAVARRSKRAAALEQLQMLSALAPVAAAQLVSKGELSHVDLFALLNTKAPAYAQVEKWFPDRCTLRGPDLAALRTPLYVGGMARLADAPLGRTSAANLPPAAQRFVGMKQAVQQKLGITWDEDVKPWIGHELSIVSHWETKWPQIGVLLGSRDEMASKATLDKIIGNLSENVLFAQQAMGGVNVTYTKLPVPKVDPGTVEPSLAVARKMLAVATGRKVMGELWDSPKKLSSAPGFSRLYGLLGRNLQYALHVDTRLVERVLDLKKTLSPSSGQRLGQRNLGRCLTNLIQVQNGRTRVDEAVCPSGGSYEKRQDKAVCSKHGSLYDSHVADVEPAGAVPEVDPREAAARKLVSALSSISVGLGRVRKDLFQLSVVFLRK